MGKFVSDRVAPLRDALYFYCQVPLLGSLLIVASFTIDPNGEGLNPSALILGLATLFISILGVLLPWQRISHRWLLVVAALDVLVVAQLRADLFAIASSLSILVLIPTLWLAYSFGLPGLILAIIGDYYVALLPYIQSGKWPATSVAWGNATLLPAIVSGVGIAVYFAARQIEKQRSQLAGAYDRLNSSLDLLQDTEFTALAMIDSVDAGITFYDPKGNILLLNDAARTLAAMAGIQSVTEMPKAGSMFYADGVTPIPPEDQIVARANRGDVHGRRTVWVGAGPNKHAVLESSQHVRRSSGELIGTLITLHDVTQLNNAIKSRDEFLATVSHELRTPLTSMIGYLEVIEDSIDLAATGIAEPFAIIERNSQRLLSLITALIIEAEGRSMPRRRPENISTLASSALEAIRPAAAEAGIVLSPPVLELVTAEVDPEDIGYVLDTLLSNAVKFSPRDATISVSVTAEDESAVVRIADTGMGIPDAEKSKVFDRFYRGSAALAAVVPGAGLGLSTAKLITESHHGTIDISSTPGHGTTVELRLPLRIGVPV